MELRDVVGFTATTVLFYLEWFQPEMMIRYSKRVKWRLEGGKITDEDARGLLWTTRVAVTVLYALYVLAMFGILK